LVQKDLDSLSSVFFDDSIFRLDADELYQKLEQVMTRIAIFKISQKLNEKQKKIDMLRVLQIFDKLINSGMKTDPKFLRQKAILDYASLDRPRPDIKMSRKDDPEFLEPLIHRDIEGTVINERQRAHFSFIQRYVPFDMAE
jgi:hypothetical protein